MNRQDEFLTKAELLELNIRRILSPGRVTGYTCATCGDLIKNPKEGGVEWWLGKDDKKYYRFRIIHRTKDCQTYSNSTKGMLHDRSLLDVVSSDGFAYFLSLGGEARDLDEWRWFLFKLFNPYLAKKEQGEINNV